MSRKATAIFVDVLLFLLILAIAFVANRLLEQPAALFNTLAAAAAGLLIVSCELYGFVMRKRNRVTSDVPRTLSLLGMNEKPLRTWELIGRTEALIGKSEGEVLADVDLSGSSFAELLEPAQAALQYTDTGWWVRAYPTRNGSIVIRRGQKILLTPGVPVCLMREDTLLLADEIRLALN